MLLVWKCFGDIEAWGCLFHVGVHWGVGSCEIIGFMFLGVWNCVEYRVSEITQNSKKKKWKLKAGAPMLLVAVFTWEILRFSYRTYGHKIFHTIILTFSLGNSTFMKNLIRCTYSSCLQFSVRFQEIPCISRRNYVVHRTNICFLELSLNAYLTVSLQTIQFVIFLRPLFPK